MSVKLTSPVLGKGVGYIYTGTLEAWLLAVGYAKRDADTSPTSYTGPGVSNKGAASTTPANDPRLPANRGDKAHFPSEADSKRNSTVANDTTNLTKTSFPNPDKPDFDQGGVDEDGTTPAADGDTDGDGTAN